MTHNSMMSRHFSLQRSEFDGTIAKKTISIVKIYIHIYISVRN